MTSRAAAPVPPPRASLLPTSRVAQPRASLQAAPALPRFHAATSASNGSALTAGAESARLRAAVAASAAAAPQRPRLVATATTPSPRRGDAPPQPPRAPAARAAAAVRRPLVTINANARPAATPAEEKLKERLSALRSELVRAQNATRRVEDEKAAALADAERRVTEAEAAVQQLQAQLQQRDVDTACRVCDDGEQDAAFVPCGHCVCVACAVHISRVDRRCHLCHALIMSTVRLFR